MMLEVLVKEIEGIPAYLAESAKLVGDTTLLQKAQATTIAAKIRLLKSFTMADAMRLQVNIKKAGWDSDHNVWLSDVVDKGVANSAAPKLGRRCVQRCMTLEL